MSDLAKRRSIRLTEYDYTTPGAYFVTICTHGNACLLGKAAEGEILLNEAGKMVKNVWDALPDHYPSIEIDAFVVMPNHMHGIIIISDNNVGAGPCACPLLFRRPRGPAPTLSLPDLVHRFKTLTTKLYADGVKQSNWIPFDKHLWQRGYYERVVRQSEDMNSIREYILLNPQRCFWESSIPENMQSLFAENI